MPNEYLFRRLTSILDILRSAYTGGSEMTSSSKGSEREAFINLVLGNVIGSPFRVGTGEITDRDGNCSGQVDIVVEYSASMSFPLLRGDSSRLYLAEGVCAVIEVKSDLAGQWPQVLKKAQQVRTLCRHYAAESSMGHGIPRNIPFFVVGYRGWQSAATLQAHLSEEPACHCIDGILAIEHGIYRGCARDDFDSRPPYSEHGLDDAWALYGFLLSLEQLTSSMLAAKPSYMPYARS
jgi:uncharacterized protein DUF6602